jgi:Glycosyl hydrolase family 79 C-terminal beta domain
VRPDYYGLQLFAQAAPVGSRLLAVRGVTHSQRLSVWATRGADGTDRVVLIDKDPGHPQTVRLPAHGPVTVERMIAPGLAATSGVTLGGRSYGRSTMSGRLAAARVSRVRPDAHGEVTVTVTGASAALLTFPPS